MRLGIVGCGDYLRWQAPALKASKRVTVAQVFDPDQNRAQQWAEKLGATVAKSAEAMIADPAIDAVALWMPPWLRAEPFIAALKAGKHVLATKPLASSPDDARRIRAAAAAAKAKAAVGYGRTGDAFARTAKAVLGSGELGRLALYKRDWVHAPPKWNTWATDPVKNGGPFMDAMIHNLNAARFLMGRPVAKAAMTSDRLAQDIPCADTETMKVDFVGGGAAYLFITWAAELATYSREGNDREHLDHLMLVTDQGWYLEAVNRDGRGYLRATRAGDERLYLYRKEGATPFDGFAAHCAGEGPWPEDLATVDEACEDLLLVRGQQPDRAAKVAG
jgi:predicted dehydrogenase